MDNKWRSIATVVGLMLAIFSLLEIFLPTSLVQPIGTLILGFILTIYLVSIGQWSWGTAFPTWLTVSIGLIVVYLFVSRPAIVVGSVIESNGAPVANLTLVLKDSSDVTHTPITDDNGAYEVKDVPEGKFTISAEGELLISGRVPSGLLRIFTSNEVEIPAVVYKPSSVAIVEDTPTVVPAVVTEIPSPSPIPPHTPVSPSPTHTPVSPAPTVTPIEVPLVEICQPTVALKPGESTVLTFTSGVSETGRQCVALQPNQQGQYTIILENANPTFAGYWVIWDYISLKEDNVPIWEIGEDETPDDYSESAFDEFCDPNKRSDCATDFTVNSTESRDFIKELNDGKFPIAKIHFTLTEEQVNRDLLLVLSTLYSTHDNIKHFKMTVNFEGISQP